MDDKTIHDRRWLALAVMCLSLAVISLDNTILNVALPVLAGHLHASTSQLQWMVDGYTLVFAGLLLTTGSLGDRFGRRGALSTGLAIFCVGSLASAFTTSATQLIFARAFMGVGAALIMPATLSLLTNVFSNPTERGRAIGVWAAVAGASGAVGPMIGGVLLRHFWWGSIFLVNVPVAIFALAAGRFLLPSSRDPSTPALDFFGAGLSVVGLVAVLWAIIEAPAKGWSNGTVVTAFLGGAVVLFCFAEWELHSSHPMLDMRFFKNRRFSAANVGLTLTFFAMLGQFFLATQYLQSVLGYTPLQAGVRAFPTACVMLVVAPFAPRLVERVGTKAVMGCGLLFASAGLMWMTGVPVEHGYPHLVASMCLLSAGMGLAMAPATESIMGSLPRTKAGVGSAMNDTTRMLGGALGVAVLGSVLATSYRPGVTSRLAHLGVSHAVVAGARDSVGGAVSVAAALPAALGRQVTAAARIEFVHGFHTAVFVGSLVVLFGAVIVFTFLPARAVPAPEPVEVPLDGVASLAFADGDGDGDLELDPALAGGGGRAAVTAPASQVPLSAEARR
jgi:EmrB/QacA subfamily drug resistance transporter